MSQASPKKRAENKHIQLAQPVEDISKVLRISRQAPKMWEVENPEKGADKGRKVHEILSYIKTTEDLNAALKRALRQGLIANSEEAEMRSLLEMTLQNKELQAYFAHGLKVKNEEEILLKNGDVLRPDRLVFEGNDVSIIDYKTGEANATHQEQILGYKLYIEQMGYKVKECVLVYINEESIELERV